MNVLDAILQRRSIRSYLDIPVPKDVISDIFLAAQMAPSSGNVQNCRYILVDDEGIKAAIADACFSQTWMISAPVFIVVISEVSQIKSMYHSRGQSNYLYQNSAAATQNMLLTATSHGLDSCWVSAFREDAISEVLDVPGSFIPTAVITVGYGAEKVPIPPRHDVRALVKMNSFTGSWNSFNWIIKNYADELKSIVKFKAKSAKGTGEFVGKKVFSHAKDWFTDKTKKKK